MAIADIIAAYKQVVARLGLAHLQQAVHELAAVEGVLAAVTEGTTTEELPTAAAQLHLAVELAGDAHQLLGRIQQLVEQEINRLGGEGGTAASSSPAGRPASRPNKARSYTPEEVADRQAALPPPVPKPNPEGKKTHGVWRDVSGTDQSMVSGKDEDSAEVWRQLQAAGMSPNREPAITAHVEAKLAAKMAKNHIQHADVVINNRPCPGMLGCDALLPVLLPAGYSLTVHGPRYRKTFTGGKKWSS